MKWNQTSTVIYESETPSRSCNNCCNSVEYVELITPSLPSLQSAFRLSVVKPKPELSKWLIGRKRERERETERDRERGVQSSRPITERGQAKTK